MTVVKKKKR